VLDGSKLESTFGIQSISWREGLDAVLDEIASQDRTRP
jgi:dTDP-4-dehydrorhamnose reductase